MSQDTDYLLCSACAFEKPRTDFNPSQLRRGPLYCKTCQRQKARDRVARRPEAELLRAARKRAKRQGLPCTITESDIIIPKICPALGIALSRGVGKSSRRAASPTLDKIIPELGYVPGNIQVISGLANLMKSYALPDQLRRFAKWILGQPLVKGRRQRGYLYKKSNAWYVRYSDTNDEGKRVQKSRRLGSASGEYESRDAARDLAEKFLAPINRGLDQPPISNWATTGSWRHIDKVGKSSFDF